jgi:acetyl-CoA carboxylase biotin carboxyl carrier protein
MDLKEIQNLIKFVAKSGASEVKLEMDDVKITIRTGKESDTKQVQQVTVPVQMPTTPVAQASVAAPATAETPKAETAAEDEKYITIISDHWHILQKTFTRQTYFRRSWSIYC